MFGVKSIEQLASSTASLGDGSSARAEEAGRLACLRIAHERSPNAKLEELIAEAEKLANWIATGMTQAELEKSDQRKPFGDLV